MKNIIKTLLAISFVILFLNGCLQLNIADEGMFKNTSGLKKLLDKGEDVNFQDDEGATALINAAYWGNLDAVKLLLKHNADVHLKDNDGMSAIIAAATIERKDDNKIIQLLVKNGANINDQDNEGDTALHTAAILGNLKTITALLDNGADPNIKNNDGETPVFHACYATENNLELLNIFINRGVNINEKNNYGESLLHIAVAHADIQTIQALLEKGLSVNGKTKYGYTPIWNVCEAEENNREIVDLLLSHGANINARDNEGDTLAATQSCIDKAELLDYMVSKGLQE